MRICGGMSEQSKKAQFENAYIFHFCRVWKSDKKKEVNDFFFLGKIGPTPAPRTRLIPLELFPSLAFL
jgi:hypothetical protein